MEGKKKRREIIIHEESKGSNKKSFREFKDDLAKSPELEEDPSIPEPHSEKVYKVRSCIVVPH